jgi:hypothetical protein
MTREENLQFAVFNLQFVGQPNLLSPAAKWNRIDLWVATLAKSVG